MAAAEQSKAAMRNVVDSELARQRRYQQQGAAIAAESLAASTRDSADSGIASGQQQRQQAYANVGKREMGVVAPQNKDVPREVSTGLAMRQGSSDAQRAAIMGYNDWLLNQQIKDIRAQRELGMIGQFSQESAGVMPYELRDAQHAGDSLRTAAGFLGGAGSAVSAADNGGAI